MGENDGNVWTREKGMVRLVRLVCLSASNDCVSVRLDCFSNSLYCASVRLVYFSASLYNASVRLVFL